MRGRAQTRKKETLQLDKYLRVTGSSRPEIFDWSEKGPQLSDEALFCLGYMLDIEAHTIVYLRELLSTSVIEDPSITAFLTCWNYDEYLHSRLLESFLATQGVEVRPERFTALRQQTAAHQFIMLGARALSRVTKHFIAVHMTWGAINEMTAIESYGAMAERTGHPLLGKLLNQVIRDERRHFAFYFEQAKSRLIPRAAQRLASTVIRRLWSPVGQPVRGAVATRRMHDFLFGDVTGQLRLKAIDAMVARLPGFEWFDLASGYK